QHGDRGEGLARVVDVGAGEVGERVTERGDEGTGAGPQVGLVQDVDRGAVLGGDVTHVPAPDGETAVGGPAHGTRPRAAPVPRGGLGGRRRGAHVRSGALTPSRSRPVASTWVVASLSHSRVRCASSTGCSPRGVTRHWSYHLWQVAASCSRYRATRWGSRSSAACSTISGKRASAPGGAPSAGWSSSSGRKASSRRTPCAAALRATLRVRAWAYWT